MAKKYVLDGYLFANATDFERAKKEQGNDTISDRKYQYGRYEGTL